MKENQFEIILSKNRLAREVKSLYKELKRPVPKFVKYDLGEIEKMTGVANQPTGRDILESNMRI